MFLCIDYAIKSIRKLKTKVQTKTCFIITIILFKHISAASKNYMLTGINEILKNENKKKYVQIITIYFKQSLESKSLLIKTTFPKPSNSVDST